MKKGDFIWIGILFLWILILVVPQSREVFISLTSQFPYIGGFIKFGILAMMGEMLGTRLVSGSWKKPNGFMFRVFVWGIIGMIVTLGFPVFSGGVEVAQQLGKLPFEGSIIAHAFLTSTVMNILQSPAVFLLHKCTDTYIDEKYKKNGARVTLKDVATQIDLYKYLEFTILKTIPFFWIPCHTIVFLFPPQYQVIVSAFASIALGLILALPNKEKIQLNV